MIYDILIIGSGPAGVTASIYAARSQKKVLVIEKEAFGGLITHSPKIENYPGFNSISGLDLADKFIAQAMDLGVNFEFDDVLEVKKEDENFVLVGENNNYKGKTLILATGSKHRTLGLPNEEALTGHGISYCAVCDGPFYADQNVVIVGGGNTAQQEAVLLAGYCKSVTMVQNLEKLTGEASGIDLINKTENIKVIYNKKVVELIGSDKLESIVVEDAKTKELEVINTDGVFVAIGHMANNEPFKNICTLDKDGFIVAGDACTTETEGLYVAGDCRQKRIRQISTAIADGTIAAVQAINYLDK
ncbi:MAG: FAD-dependent oxidoreductase [Bacilli bacterium]|nr:FAD-dependent oxidoreductase [Bacilli bacterium]